MIKVRVLGAKQSAANIRRMSAAVRKRYYEEILKLSREILSIAKTQYVPYLTGALKRSGKVKGFPGRYPVVYTSFGNESVPYALIQHENLSFFHPGGKRAKYLELAVDDMKPEMERRLAVAARNETKKYSMAGKGIVRV
jgi:hypothetical protein